VRARHPQAPSHARPDSDDPELRGSISGAGGWSHESEDNSDPDSERGSRVKTISAS
jgi:hypothetical protein